MYNIEEKAEDSFNTFWKSHGAVIRTQRELARSLYIIGFKSGYMNEVEKEQNDLVDGN